METKTFLMAAITISTIWLLIDVAYQRGWLQKLADFFSDRCSSCEIILERPIVCNQQKLGDFMKQEVICPACGAKNVRIVPLLTPSSH